ncbi:MAG TPA: periplasmic heavy metal sensor [Gemmatimonadales bacterium]|nr:periplasmic heavy metal sensor [Gemmatimonadales bacterium]
MFDKSKVWAVALLAAVFVAGGAAGYALSLHRHDDRRGGPDQMVRYLTKELGLTPPQQDSVRAIFVRHRNEMEQIWKEVRPKYDSVRAEVHREIDALLTPEQRQKNARLIEQMEHRHRGDSASTRTQGGKPQ